MIIFFLEKLRRIFKSLGKLEEVLIDKITLIQKQKIKQKVAVNDQVFLDYNNNFKKKINYPQKMVIVVCFYYNSKKIEILKKTINEIYSYKFKIELFLMTNKLSNLQKANIKRILQRNKISKIIEINNLPDGNLLPWFSINLMREKFKNKSYSHFMFLEDDLLVNQKNICYWIYFRKVLKKYNLVPGFLRYENYKKMIYVIDFPKEIELKKNPTIFSKNFKHGFINLKYPYSAMYLMDRSLMGEYLNSNATKVDFSFNKKFLKSKYPIKELLNVSHAYINIPKGYFNKIVIPFEHNKKILKSCLIEHAEIKYSNSFKLNKLGLKKIKLNDLIKNN